MIGKFIHDGNKIYFAIEACGLKKELPNFFVTQFIEDCYREYYKWKEELGL